jgi:phage gp46-like protein
MPLSDDGGDVALVRNPLNGRFDLDWDDGNPVFDDSKMHTVLSLVLESQAKWWADQTGKRGSRLYTLRNDTRTTRSELIAILQEALAPAIADGRIRDLVVTADRVAAGRYAFDLGWKTRSGLR